LQFIQFLFISVSNSSSPSSTSSDGSESEPEPIDGLPEAPGVCDVMMMMMMMMMMGYLFLNPLMARNRRMRTLGTTELLARIPLK
jgi:hypothetical protein